jgi:small-conductance mechanosensitive channel
MPPSTTGLYSRCGVWGDSLVRSWRGHYRARDENGPSATSAAFIDFVLRLVVWIVFTLMVLDNLGFNITTLVASLGISGIAVALAVQNRLKTTRLRGLGGDQIIFSNGDWPARCC